MNQPLQNAKPDSKELFLTLLDIAEIKDNEKSSLVESFESAVYSRTLKALLELLPSDESRKLSTTMRFQPDFFLSRVITILQTFADIDQIVRIMEETAEETFLEFFDLLIKTTNDSQKEKLRSYIETIDLPLEASFSQENPQTVNIPIH